MKRATRHERLVHHDRFDRPALHLISARIQGEEKREVPQRLSREREKKKGVNH